MMRVVVTGATGFVGSFVCRALDAAGARIVAAGRGVHSADGVLEIRARIDADTSLEQMCAELEGADAVVHLAAAVHDVRGRTPEAHYLRVNRDYPLRLAEAADRVGVQRFVFVSTVKVNGESTRTGEAFHESMPPAPRGSYAQSKWLAEEGLRELSARGRIQTRIVRPPLVYGPGVRANFLSLMRWVKRGVPLPFAGVDNARSLIYVENLAELLVRLAVGQRLPAPSRTYLACDGEDLSTAALVRRIAQALGVTPRLFRFPEPALRRGLTLMRRVDALNRLMSSLRIDATLVRREIGWSPPHSVDVGLARTAGWLNEQS